MPGGAIRERTRWWVTGSPAILDGVAVAIGAVHVMAGEALVDRVDPAKPLDAGHAVPAGHDQATKRKAVLRLQRLAVHGVDSAGARRRPYLFRCKRALVALHLARLHAGVLAGEDDVDGSRRLQARLLPGSGRVACRSTRPCRSRRSARAGSPGADAFSRGHCRRIPW